MRFAEGDRVGPYQILAVVGTGGMGTVYRAFDARLQRDVALKFLHDDGEDGASRARLLHEARAASALNHPNVCTVYDVGDGRAPFIAMEFVDGGPLERQLPPGGFPPDIVTRYGIQIADALAHAHARGIVHRDLKPANIVVTSDGRIKVLDFGLARKDRAVSAATTRVEASAHPDGELCGTLAYMAPELLRGERADERSDLWALGAVLYQLASGVLPFRGRTATQMISAILQEPPAPLPASVPAGLRATIARLLSRDPALRFHAAGEVRAVLESGQATTSARSGVVAKLQRRPRPRLWMVVGGTAIVAIVAWLAVRSGDDRSAPRLTGHHLLSTFAGSHHSPTFSPEADLVAFVAPDMAGVSQLWVKNLREGAAIQITSGEAPVSRPRWSPSGGQILFTRQGQGIWSVAPLGGSARRILENGLNPNFSRDGRHIVYEWQNRIWMADADGANARMADWIPAKFYSVPAHPAWSPDGLWIAYFRPEAGPNGDLWIAPANGGGPRQLTFDLREGGAPIWMADSRRIVFSSARAGSRTLWQIDIDVGEVVPLTTGTGEDDQPDISLNGRQLVYTNVKHTWELRVRDAGRADDRLLLEKRTEINFPLFSPDGERLVFFGREGRAVGIFTIGVDGTELRQLTAESDLNHMPRWSADGAWVHFYQIVPTLSFRRVPAVGGPSEQVFPWRWETHNAIQFSPDGKRLVYVRRPDATIVRHLQSNAEHALAGGPLLYPRWSPDGRLVMGSIGSRVLLCEADGSTCRQIAEGYIPTFDRDGTRLYFLRPGRTRDVHELWSAGVDGADPRSHGELGPFRGGTLDLFYDVSSRGALAWAPYREGRRELWAATLE